MPDLHHSIRHGVAHRSQHGRGGYVRYPLVHPSLGKLLLKAASTPVDDLQTFCAAAKKHRLLGMIIAARLEAHDRSQESAEVLRTILKLPKGLQDSTIVPGLQYTRSAVERVARLGVISLTETDHGLASQHAELAASVLRTPLGDLAAFLEYAEGKLPEAHTAAAKVLADPNNLKTLGETALRTLLNALVKFLRSVPMAGAVLAELDKERCDECRCDMKSELPSYMPALSKELNRIGRPDLAAAPARALIVAAEAQHWHSPGIGMGTVSHTLRLGGAAGPDAISHFLDLVVTDAWLDEQYSNASPGSIAASLYSLWGHCDQPVVDRFRTEALRTRVAAEIRMAVTASVPLLSQILQLLGCFSLVGEDAHSMSAVWPNEVRVREVLEYAAPKLN